MIRDDRDFNRFPKSPIKSVHRKSFCSSLQLFIASLVDSQVRFKEPSFNFDAKLSFLKTTFFGCLFLLVYEISLWLCFWEKHSFPKLLLAMDVYGISQISEYDNIFEVFDIKNIPSLMNVDESLDEERDIFDMTSLSALMLLNQNESKTTDSNPNEKERLSLAYERLQTMPKLLLQELAPFIKILDISNNKFDNLDFLSEFKELTSLICDHNNINSSTIIPYMPKLELLWMNHCKISELYPWARKLQQSCPELRYLSLMGNKAAPSYLNGGNFYEYVQYRLFIISLFPNLVHLDDRTVTEDQIQEAKRLYKRPLLERLVSKAPATKLPTYLRSVSEKVSEIFAPTPPFSGPQKNIIV